jgi:hypothetical protein
MEPRNTGTGNIAADQQSAAKTSKTQTTGTSATQADNLGTTQETANFSPPGKQGYQPGGSNTSGNR